MISTFIKRLATTYLPAPFYFHRVYISLQTIMKFLAFLVSAALAGSVPLSLASSISRRANENHGSKPKFNWDEIKFVHAFGDSYSFVQGTDGNANFRCVYSLIAFCCVNIHL